MASPATNVSAKLIRKNPQEAVYRGSVTLRANSKDSSVEALGSNAQIIDSFGKASTVIVLGDDSDNRVHIQKDTEDISLGHRGLQQAAGVRNIKIYTGSGNDKVVIDHLEGRNNFRINYHVDFGTGESESLHFGVVEPNASLTLSYRAKAPRLTFGGDRQELDLSEYSGPGQHRLTISKDYKLRVTKVWSENLSKSEIEEVPQDVIARSK